jgi:hypothetical protein
MTNKINIDEVIVRKVRRYGYIDPATGKEYEVVEKRSAVKDGALAFEVQPQGSVKVTGHVYDPESVVQGERGLINSTEWTVRDWRFIRLYFQDKQAMQEWTQNPIYEV